LSLPAPYEALNDSPNLIDTEREDLAACEAAIDGLRIAFWAAGKALQVIRDARLYRADYDSFDDYCRNRWQMQRRHADRLIAEWQLAEELRPIGLTNLNEAQVRVLLPVESTHGRPAAVAVYAAASQAVEEAEAGKVTAAVLQGVVSVIPVGEFDAEAAALEVRAYVARLAEGEDSAAGAGKPAERTFDEAADRVRVQFRKSLDRPLFRRVAKRDPEQFRRVLAGLRQELDEIEQKLTTPRIEGRRFQPSRAGVPVSQPTAPGATRNV
jgi:hypothetical protein